jgi:hypothetical protein
MEKKITPTFLFKKKLLRFLNFSAKVTILKSETLKRKIKYE